jgi:DNA-binding NarL/FixJ family response regulator
MGLRGKKISASSLEIVRMLKRGMTTIAIMNLGYSENTIRYYRYKLFYPSKFKKKIKQINRMNKARLKKLSTVQD